MSVNLSIQSEATSSYTLISGNTTGSGIGAVRDDDTITYFGVGTGAGLGGTATFASTQFVTWVTPSIVSTVSIVHQLTLAGRVAAATHSWNLSVFIGGAYTQVASTMINSSYNTTYIATGNWENVKGLRYIETGRIAAVPPSGNATLYHYTKEFQATGTYVSVPTLVTLSATSVTIDGATLIGSISDTGNSAASTRGFDWGTDTSYGGIITESGTFGVASYSLATTGLQVETLYHYRAKAYNFVGWGYGNDITFVTLPSGDVTRVRGRSPDGGRFGINMG